jgi:serine/threonine protein kinase
MVGNLRIEALIGRGAMGEVFRASQVNLKRPVAVKRIAEHLLSTPDAILRFEREAQCLARVQSPYVIGVHDFGLMKDEDGQDHFLLVMELVEGARSLRSCTETPMRWEEATGLMLHVARGLAAASEFGVIHRDVKPHNIIVSLRGIAKLADFGLARSVDSTDLTTHGTVLGTPAYMAPEACRGEPVDGRGDLYSLGVTWYQLLCGRTPFQSDNTPGMLRAHVDDTPPPLASLAPQVPARICELVHRCLEKEPRNRPANAVVLIELIRRLADDGLVIPDLVILPPLDGLQPDPATAATHLAPSSPKETATLPLSPPSKPVISQSAPVMSEAQGVHATSATQSVFRGAQGGRWRWIAAGVIAVVALTLVVQSRHRGFAYQSQPVRAAQAAGNVLLAERLADELVKRFPDSNDALLLDQQVVSDEITHSLAADGIPATRLLLAQRVSGRDWIDHEALATRIDLAEAEQLVQSKSVDEALSAYELILKRHPNDVSVLTSVVSHLAEHAGNEVVVTAAVHLAELSAQPGQDDLALLRSALWRWDSDSDLMKRARQQLIRHDPTIITECRSRIDSGDSYNTSARFDAYALLNEAQALTSDDRLRFHLVNLIQLTSSFEQFRESLTYLETASQQPDWTAAKAAAHCPAFTSVAALDSWPNEWSTRVMALLARAFVPEIQPAIPRWLASKTEALRFNAWSLMHAAKLDGRFDDFAFHAQTLVSFDPDSESPSMDAALAYFLSRKDTADRERAHQALLAGEAYVDGEWKIYRERLPLHAPYVHNTWLTIHATTVQLEAAGAAAH